MCIADSVLADSGTSHAVLKFCCCLQDRTRALTRAGVDNTLGGAHLFRNAAATNMLTGGARFNEIADVLGHVCLKATAIYAKLDLTALSAISMPWPGSES